MTNKLQIVIISVLIPLGILYWYLNGHGVTVRDIFLPGTPVMRIGEIPLRVEIANTEEALAQGLSGRSDLGGKNGMLFVFSETEYHSMWMKDMLFPIDIIWISEDLEVIEIQRNLSPESYPKVFRSSEPARYAVETNTNFSDTFGIRPGLSVVLPEGYLEK